MTALASDISGERGEHLGVVAGGHRATCEAASEALHAGGNAFDAVVAAGFASAVAEPMLTSVGGGGFLQALTESGDRVLFDFFVDTPGRGLEDADLDPHFHPVTVHFPGADQVFNVGRGAVAVPGTLKGLLHIHERLGRLPLDEVVAPAWRLAANGVDVTPEQAYVLELLTPIHSRNAEGRELFSPGDRVLGAGERFVNEDFAAFLESLPVGAGDDVYTGGFADRIDADMRAGDGLLTAADLAAYAVCEREPLTVGYRGWTLLTNPAPSFGGTLIGLSLELLEAKGAATGPWGGAGNVTDLVDVMCEVDRRRDAGTVPGEAAGDAAREDVRRPRVSRGTTHVSVADAAGNVAAMTTSNGEGSGYFVPGTGIQLNNMMGEDDLHPEGFHAAPPGVRVASMMAPSILLQDGRPRLAFGSGGSKRIRTALLQVATAVVDHGAGVADAVEAPRLHWDGDTLQVEPGLSGEVLDELRTRWPVNLWEARNLYFGGVHAVDPHGAGAGDPRRGGRAQLVN